MVTTSRADYGILLPVLRAIDADPALELRLLVSGTHLAPEFGYTVDQIERDGFDCSARLELLLASGSPLGVAKSMGLGTLTFADFYAHRRPDLVLVTGDRFEMHAAAVAALPFKIPLAHIHGGEVTAGAFDDALRHCITKLSHVHFVATAEARERVLQLGEEPWRITISGAPSLDNIAALPALAFDELERRIGMPLAPAPLLVTFHPVTLQYEQTAAQIDELLAALEASDAPIVFTLPNADPSGDVIRRRIEAFVSRGRTARICDNLGSRAYFALMRVARAMVGNSSSGIIEAASFGLPVVNVGDRQAGRQRARNVIDAAPDRVAIAAALAIASGAPFRSSLSGLANPYGSGNAAEVIVARLRDIELDDRLIVKRFHDLGAQAVQYA